MVPLPLPRSRKPEVVLDQCPPTTLPHFSPKKSSKSPRALSRSPSLPLPTRHEQDPELPEKIQNNATVEEDHTKNLTKSNLKHDQQHLQDRTRKNHQLTKSNAKNHPTPTLSDANSRHATWKLPGIQLPDDDQSPVKHATTPTTTTTPKRGSLRRTISSTSSSKSMMIPVLMKSEFTGGDDEKWAGSVCSKSPPPCSLPFPRFSPAHLQPARSFSVGMATSSSSSSDSSSSSTSKSSQVPCNWWDMDFATRDLKRILNLDQGLAS